MSSKNWQAYQASLNSEQEPDPEEKTVTLWRLTSESGIERWFTHLNEIDPDDRESWFFQRITLAYQEPTE